MATWTSFYINIENSKSLVDKLIDLTDNLLITSDTNFPFDIGDYQMLNLDISPNYIAIGNTQSDWTTVVHNSLDKMEDWAILLSSHFSCKLIVTIAQSVSSYYYFALYDKGEKLREIEACNSDDSEGINLGEKFDFENDEPGVKHVWNEKEYYTFDFETIEEYCNHFNLTIQSNYNLAKWTILKGQSLKREINEYVQKFLIKKPWWKFW